MTTVIATWNDDYPAQKEPLLICQGCGETLCSVEEGDEFQTIVMVLEAHRCPANVVLPDGTMHEGRLQRDDDGEPIVIAATCGTCGFSWNDALITSITPVPAGRCPNEYGHKPSRADRLNELARQCQEIYDDRTAEALGGEDVPRYALMTSEGSADSSYRDNPDLRVFDDLTLLAEAIAGNMEEGWPPVKVLDLETGEDVGYRVRVEMDA